MKKVVSVLGCVLAFKLSAYAGFTPITLTPNSYNHDVVVEKTAPGPIQLLVNANMDAGTNIHGLFGGNGGNHGTFYENTFHNATGSGLPIQGSLVNAVSDTNHVFRMPSDYSTNNAVFIGGSQLIAPQIGSGSLILTTPGAFKKLSVLNAAGSGPATVSYTVQFQDGSSEQGTFVATDWLSTVAPDTNTTAVIVNGYLQGSSGNAVNVNATQRSPRLFYNDLTLANSNGVVTRVDFSYTVDNRRVAIFGLSGSSNGTNFSPLTVTGFNRDMVVESHFLNLVTATPSGGTNKTDSAFYETGFAKGIPGFDLSGLPHPGNFTAVSNANITFQMLPYTSNNAVMLDSSVPFVIATLETPAAYKKLVILAAAGQTGSATLGYTVIHSDFSSTAGSVTPQSWIGSTATNLAFLAGGRAAMDRAVLLDSGTGGKLYYYIINLANTTPVSSVNLSHTGTGRSMVFALSGDVTGGGVFNPIALSSGFNADLVLEQEAGTNIYAKAFTTATVGGGTNNNAQSFYEKGWNTLAPGSGMPLANSVITSATFPDRDYQMPPSYTVPNAVFIHTNAPLAHLTFVNPTNYSALSILATTANQVEVEVVVHFEGAVSETNTVVIRDWFNSAAGAYTMAGSVNTDNRAASSWTPGTTSARLFDNLVPLENLVNKVTGVTLRWTGNNGSGGISTGTRPFIFAVSGLVPEGSPAITLQPVSSAAYSGSNIVLSVSVNGAVPITYQWQACAIGSPFSRTFTTVTLSRGLIPPASALQASIFPTAPTTDWWL